MKPQTIELEDGSKYKLAPPESQVYEAARHWDHNGEQYAWILFKRLPPENAMPELKVGYRVFCEHYGERLIKGLDGSAFYGIHFGTGRDFWIQEDDVKEIHCPHRGLIWSK